MRIYVDTSVIGGVFDTEFEKWSKALIDEIRDGKVTMILSDLTLQELEQAPAQVFEVISNIPGKNIEYALLSNGCRTLAEAYMDIGGLSPRLLIDSQHIALATISEVDVLVSWNFRHIVNLEKIQFYNNVNKDHGYTNIEIRTPREVLHEG